LFPHATKRWAKKIRGTMHYFGPWSDPEGALARYEAEKDALHAGRKPREATEGLTVKELVNRFLEAKEALVDSGELTARSWADYKAACDLIVPHFGKARLVADLAPEEFAALRSKMAKKWGPVRLGNVIQRIRTVFKFGFDDGMLDRPMRFGPGFKRPSKKTLRLERARRGAKLFTPEEVRALLDLAGVQLKAMVLLGINAGYGNADCGNLPLSALDLARGWADYPRPKTGVARHTPLWPETVEALRAALAKRPQPKDPAHAGLAFITKYGQPWAKDSSDQTLSKEFTKLMKAAGITGRKGLNFYGLRHTHRTTSDEARDPPAADHLMGHEVASMSAVYRETISEARLRAVTDYVHAWLFPPAQQGQQQASA
jgi:integrase